MGLVLPDIKSIKRKEQHFMFLYSVLMMDHTLSQVAAQVVELRSMPLKVDLKGAVYSSEAQFLGSA